MRINCASSTSYIAEEIVIYRWSNHRRSWGSNGPTFPIEILYVWEGEPIVSQLFVGGL